MECSACSSLRFKIIRNISIVIILFLGAFQGYKYFDLKIQLEEELKSNTKSIMQRLLNELKNPLWNLDEDSINVILKSEAKVKYVHAIYIEGDDNIHLSFDKDSSGSYHDDNSYISLIQSISYDEKKIGEIKLIITREFINQRLSEELKSAVFLTLIQILLMILLLWFVLNNTILTPIDSLVKSTKLIADGKYENVKLDLRKDEIGLLGKSIEKMSEKIALREEEIKSSAEQLKSVKERLEEAVTGTQDGIWDWDVQSNVVYFSVPWKKMIGYEDDELANTFESWESKVHPDDLEQAKQEIIKSHNSKDGHFECLHRLQHKNGSWVWILARGKTIFNEERKPVRMVGFHTDMTKQKELENELIEQEEIMIAQSRHVAMGEMISMIAHQWRQPLTVISMDANKMTLDIAIDKVSVEKFEDYARSILKQTEYLSKTIDDFKNFFRPNKDKDIVNVCDVVLEAKQLMGTSIVNSNIELIFVDTIDETINTYSRELLQVILNLLKNSKDVLEEKDVKNAYIKISVKSINDSIVIQMCDNGGGIDDDIKEKVFEPYFSTKGSQVGTGLGLYMSKTIIEKHLLGTISFINTHDGTCFEVSLPRNFEDKDLNE